jgi:hypothetical protein
MSAAERVGLDEAWVLRNLKRNAVMAARAGDRAASNRAAELIGKHIGMFIDKKQIEISYIDELTSIWPGSWRSSTPRSSTMSRRRFSSQKMGRSMGLMARSKTTELKLLTKAADDGG